MSEVFNPLRLSDDFDLVFGKDAVAARKLVTGLFLKRLARHSRGMQFVKLKKASSGNRKLSLPVGFIKQKNEPDLFEYERLRASHGSIPSHYRSLSYEPIEIAIPTTRERMEGLARFAQPAVVKMISTGGGMASASSMVRYTSRDAAMALERENGELVTTKEEQRLMLEEWQQFFDKREPSRDVVTLTMTCKDDETDIAFLKTTLGNICANQRFVMGETLSEQGHRQIVTVMTIASQGKGRIKTTSFALQKIKQSIEINKGIKTDNIDLSYGKVGHSVYGLNKQLSALVERNIVLTGPWDKSITQDNIAKVARSWSKDLRSSGNRDVMHLVVSGRAGTDQDKLLKAVRCFFNHEFDGHKYAFAMHGPDDPSKPTEHVHIHAMIVMRNSRGAKLNPYKRDFHRWREVIAHYARENDIDMIATRRSDTLNPVPFTQAEHALVKADKALPRIENKVKAKRKNVPTVPLHTQGQYRAYRARQELGVIVKEQTGPLQNLTEAISLGERYDQTIARSTQHQFIDKIGKAIDAYHYWATKAVNDFMLPFRDEIAPIILTEVSKVRNTRLSVRGKSKLHDLFYEKTKAADDRLVQVIEKSFGKPIDKI